MGWTWPVSYWAYRTDYPPKNKVKVKQKQHRHELTHKDVGLWRVCGAFLYDDDDDDDHYNGDDDWLIAGSLQVCVCVCVYALFTGCSAGVACSGRERHVICLNRAK